MLLELYLWEVIGLIFLSMIFTTLAAWFYFNNKITILLSENKHQNDILNERESAIKSATDPLREVFYEMANKSLQTNSENLIDRKNMTV